VKKFISALFLFASISTLAASPAFAQQGYEELPNPVKRADTDRVEVVEYFWFGCPHCFRFEPNINEWAASKPDYVDFVQEAPPLNGGWVNHSKAFYAAQVMGVTEKFMTPMFDAIHKEKKRMNSPKAIAKFAGTLGIDEQKFLKTMNSFAVDVRMKNAIKLAQRDGISSVPSIVINGKYRTSGSIAGSNEKVIEVIRELTAREHSS